MSKYTALLSALLFIGMAAYSIAPVRADGLDPCCQKTQRVERHVVGYKVVTVKRRVPIYAARTVDIEPAPCCAPAKRTHVERVVEVPVVVVRPRIIVEEPVIENRPAPIVRRQAEEVPCPPDLAHPAPLPSSDCCEGEGNSQRRTVSTRVSWHNNGPSDICEQRRVQGLPKGVPFTIDQNGRQVTAKCE